MNVFLENKYTKKYYKIINTALEQNRKKNTTAYYESHHIIPEHFYINRSRDGEPGWLPGDPESSDNKVLLTFREHRTCHLLLRKMVSDDINKSGIYFAALLMASRKNENGEYEPISSRLYEEIKMEAVRANSERDTTKWSGDNHWSRRDPIRFRELMAGDNHWMSRNPEAKQRFLDDHPNADGRNAKAAVASGRHVWHTNNPSIQRSKDGTHQMFRRADGSSIGSDANNKRISEGTHNFLGSELNQARIDAGTHNLLGPDSNLKRLAEGTHPSQSETTCLCCRWTVPTSMFKRWHGDNCHMNPASGRYNPELKPRIKKK